MPDSKPTSAFASGRWTVRLVGVAILALAPALAAPAWAQSSDLQGLMAEVQRLQRDLNTLQRYVYRGEQPPESAITEVYGAEGAVSKNQAARIDLRLSQLETEIRSLTGELEQQSFRIDGLAKRLDKLVADVDGRLRRLEQRTGGQSADPALGASAAEPTYAGSSGAAGGGSQAAPSSTPGTLGTVSPEALAAVQTQSVEQGSAEAATGEAPSGAAYAFPGQTPEENYSHAFNLLSQTNYAQAERALNAFLAEYPEHRLAGNAKYWLGETYYVRGQYKDAAVTFAEGYQKYPDSAKAPDNLLKLGKSLAALGEVNDACGTYGELLRRFPNASATVLQQADRERRRLACP